MKMQYESELTYLNTYKHIDLLVNISKICWNCLRLSHLSALVQLLANQEDGI